MAGSSRGSSWTTREWNPVRESVKHYTANANCPFLDSLQFIGECEMPSSFLDSLLR